MESPLSLGCSEVPLILDPASSLLFSNSRKRGEASGLRVVAGGGGLQPSEKWSVAAAKATFEVGAAPLLRSV